MPLVQTRGAASAQGFGEFAQVTAVNYIDDVFSTYLYTGTGSAQTITNGIDLSTKGGLVWIKQRNGAYNQNHSLTDTTRGAGYFLSSDTTSAQSNTPTQAVSAFTTSGFSLTGNDNQVNGTYPSPISYASWTFRKQAKFFDIQTYTGTGVAGKIVTHNLGSVPGCIIVKKTSGAEQWSVYHVGAGSVWTLVLNDTSAKDITNDFNYTNGLTSTEFQVGSNTPTNQNGATYVAYLFAHNAGGFGLTGTDNVISCGSLTTSAGGVGSATLGYEPQWVLFKRTDSAQNWVLMDNMRNFISSPGDSSALYPNLSSAENLFGQIAPNATGFSGSNFSSSATYIYIAIRRGPMKVPTLGTSVFSPVARAGTSATATVTAGFPVDMTIIQDRNGLNSFATAFDRLRGATKRLFTALTLAEATEATSLTGFDVQTGFTLGTDLGFGAVNTSPDNYINWCFGRAPGFFDEVCYTGTGVARTVTHNLTTVPELMIVKSRSLAQNGVVYSSSTGNANYLRLFSTSSDSGETATSFWNSTTPTASVFSLGTANNVNGSAETYVAYLFATCAGVSKVGSYTGTGATQTINCGFTGGARFVLIKKSTSTAPDRDWYVWDTARGMTSGTDPSLKINTTAAEVNADDVYTITTGFQIVSSSNYVNASGVTYIFLAIA